MPFPQRTSNKLADNNSDICADSAVIYQTMNHSSTLERCSYVCCLMIDFSKAFNRVDHPTLLAKRNKLDLPPHAINWIISYLSGRSQILKCEDQLSASAEINTSIVQGSGIGPMLFVVMESDLSTMSSVNIRLKYADDTSLLEPSDSDTDLVDEFDNTKQWAAQNHMVINLQKTKEVVFR